jgi:phosphoserine phosphatase RsbU/P
VTRSPHDRILYAVLAAIFIGSVAFQTVISAEVFHHIWADSRHFDPSMLRSWDLEFIAHVLTPFLCLLLGFYVAGVRIRDGRAWLLLAILTSFSVMVDGANKQEEAMQWATPFNHLALVYRSLALYTFPFWLALFAIYFPEQAEWELRRPALKWIVLIPLGGLSGCMTVFRVLANERSTPILAAMRDTASQYWLWAFYLSLLFFLAALPLKLAFTTSPDSRRRLRVLLFGIALALVPITTVNLVARWMGTILERVPLWVFIPVLVFLLSFPLTIAYVTVVERALDVGLVIREGVQYALARRGVVLLQLFISVVVILLVAAYAGRMTFLSRLLLTAVGVAAVLLMGLVAKRLASWIDRRFFREAYSSEQILNQLAESVGSMVELPVLLRTVVTRISEALHVSKIAVFLLEQQLYRPAFVLGFEPSEQAVLSENSTIQALTTIRLGRTDGLAATMTNEEAGLLRRIDSQLLLPLARKDRMLGFISLGPRRSEAPYSTSDVDLLRTVATHTALAVENSRLTSAIAAETAEREVINRELTIAREVQQRLFPQRCPEVAGVAYYGTCRPAREVGGDYYDFLELPGNNLGIVIGDVSGKGVPASLLMASLHASIRGQALVAQMSAQTVVENLSRFTYAATQTNRYATFFYSVYDPVKRSLTYVNAGHNPPILLRSLECIRLEAGGPPVGLLPDATYVQTRIDLQAGDLLALFTDGVSEAMNGAEEEWGESNLIEVLRAVRCKEPTEIARAAFAAADDFAGNAPQHDDMTLLVFSINQ